MGAIRENEELWRLIASLLNQRITNILDQGANSRVHWLIKPLCGIIKQSKNASVMITLTL
jgi:hypothetical protein